MELVRKENNAPSRGMVLVLAIFTREQCGAAKFPHLRSGAIHRAKEGSRVFSSERSWAGSTYWIPCIPSDRAACTCSRISSMNTAWEAGVLAAFRAAWKITGEGLLARSAQE